MITPRITVAALNADIDTYAANGNGWTLVDDGASRWWTDGDVGAAFAEFETAVACGQHPATSYGEFCSELMGVHDEDADANAVYAVRKYLGLDAGTPVSRGF